MIRAICKKTIILVCLTATLSITGCGGGGGSSIPTTPTTPTTTSALKGFWTGSQGTSGVSAIVLANGDTWLVFTESGSASSFARMQTLASSNSFSSSGTRYLLQTGATEAATASGIFAEKVTLGGTITTASASNNFNIGYDTRYDTTTASLADSAGTWVGIYGGGASKLTMTITSTGALTGNSTTGCNYIGIIQTRPADLSVFDLNITETCLVGPAKTLSGIATLNVAKTGISIAVTTADKAQGALFAGTRQ